MNRKHVWIAMLILSIVTLYALWGGGHSQTLAGSSFVETYRRTSEAKLLDVRTPSEFAAGHLEGAMSIDFENPSFASEVEKLDKNKPYFLYCRSGNRSGQAVAIMKKEGFTNITELQGGISSNPNAFHLVTDTSSSSSEYAVDAGDMVDGGTLLAGIAQSSVNEAERDGLLQMREEEKLARDVYMKLGEKWGLRIFSNIANSEQTHTDSVKLLLDHYSIADPSAGNAAGVFRSPTMQKLYDDLTAKGVLSLADALSVGASIEDLDIRDLDTLMGKTNNQEILVTYKNLQKGSRNHLRAFVNNLTRAGGDYVPQYISQEEYSMIINSAQERGMIAL